MGGPWPSTSGHSRCLRNAGAGKPLCGSAPCGAAPSARGNGIGIIPVFPSPRPGTPDGSPGEALRPQRVPALLLQRGDAPVQPGEGGRLVAEGAGGLRLMHHVRQRQPVRRQDPAVPARCPPVTLPCPSPPPGDRDPPPCPWAPPDPSKPPGDKGTPPNAPHLGDPVHPSGDGTPKSCTQGHLQDTLHPFRGPGTPLNPVHPPEDQGTSKPCAQGHPQTQHILMEMGAPLNPTHQPGNLEHPQTQSNPLGTGAPPNPTHPPRDWDTPKPNPTSWGPGDPQTPFIHPGTGTPPNPMHLSWRGWGDKPEPPNPTPSTQTLGTSRHPPGAPTPVGPAPLSGSSGRGGVPTEPPHPAMHLLVDEDPAHAQGAGNGTGMLPPRTPKAGQHVAGGVVAPCLVWGTHTRGGDASGGTGHPQPPPPCPGATPPVSGHGWAGTWPRWPPAQSPWPPPPPRAAGRHQRRCRLGRRRCGRPGPGMPAPPSPGTAAGPRPDQRCGGSTRGAGGPGRGWRR